MVIAGDSISAIPVLGHRRRFNEHSQNGRSHVGHADSTALHLYQRYGVASAAVVESHVADRGVRLEPGLVTEAAGATFPRRNLIVEVQPSLRTAVRACPYMVGRTLAGTVERLLPTLGAPLSFGHWRHGTRPWSTTCVTTCVLTRTLMSTDRTSRFLHNGLGYAFGRIKRILVLPYAHDRPARSRETGVGVAVPRHVPVQLLPPPLGVRSRLRTVLGTGVPVAPVHKDSDPLVSEHEVCAASEVRERPGVEAVAQSSSVQQATES